MSNTFLIKRKRKRIGFKPGKSRILYSCRSDYAITFCASAKGHYFTGHHAHAVIFGLFTPSCHSSDHCSNICYFGIIGILPMKGSYLVLVCLTSIYQPLWLFSRLFFLCLYDMQASQKASRTALMFLSFDLSEHSGLMYLGGGSLALSSLSSLSSKDINWIALCRSNKAFILALSSGESCALSNTSVRFINFWTPRKTYLVTCAWLLW